MSVEQRGNAAFVGDPAHGLANDRGDAEDADAVGLAGRGSRQDRVGDDEFGQGRIVHARHRGAGQDAVGDVGRRPGGAGIAQRLRRVAQGSGQIDDVVDQDAAAAPDVADDVHDFGLAGALAAFVDDRERRVVQPFGQPAGADYAADVGRDDHQVAGLRIALRMSARHDRRGVEVVGRDIEEALDLPGVQVNREDPVGAGVGDQVGDQLGGDRRARAGLAVLPGVAEVGDHRGDALGRGAPQRVDADQQLHQVVVGREAGRLQQEDILAAHVLVDLDEDLVVGEAAYAGVRSAAISR